MEKAEMRVRNKFHRLTNCQLAVDTGKKMKFSLVGVAGSDIEAGNKKLTLALVWQLMRYHIIKFLSSLSVGGKQVTDADIIAWCNGKAASVPGGRQISSFSDPEMPLACYHIVCSQRTLSLASLTNRC
eukprot:GABV01002426.1.p1 GENE.GABV01002426.1~~GABV01002426.1.p1  ORF type:complete len:128 (+),score=43.73 GABV01002426.1:291-674(+)